MKGKYHSTVTRRNFMKAIGIGAAGIGASTAVAPVFHDMDEVMSSSKSVMKRPWYVKEVEKPTVEIDLNLRTQFGADGETNIVGGMLQGRAEYNSSPELVASWNKQWGVNLERDYKNGPPGSDRRDIVLHRAALGAYALSRPVEGFRYNTPDQIVPGSTKWQGTPEENALMMRTVCHLFGHSWVGYVDLDDMSYGPRRSLFNFGNVFDDTDDYYRGADRVRHFPLKANRLISLIWQTAGHWKDIATETVRGCAHNFGFARSDAIENFIWSMGYQTFRVSSPGPPWQIMAGLSEYDRTHGPGVKPEGYLQTISTELITNMPLAPTPPIDFGVLQFCKTCKKCADLCPGDAIDHEDEPTWERATGRWSASNDHKGYPNHSDRCWTIWAEGRDGISGIRGGFYPLPAIQCSTCTWACPFTKEHTSWIHDLSKVAISNTSLFNSFFRVLDDFAGYGELPDSELVDSFWTTPMGAFGFEEVVKDY